MKAIILAAGRGSRMNEATENIPKCLMKLCGKTLLDRCIESLTAAGFLLSDIAIVTGYKSEKIKVDGVKYFHNADWETTNMFVSLTKTAQWLESDTCIVSYSDIVYTPNAIEKLMRSAGDFAITYYTKFWDLWCKRFDNPLDDLETFKMNNGKLVEIGKKPSSSKDVEGQYMGLLKFTPDGWRNIENAVKLEMPKPVEKLDMTTLLQHLLTLGYSIETIPTDELWLECDNQNDVSVYESQFADL